MPARSALLFGALAGVAPQAACGGKSGADTDGATTEGMPATDGTTGSTSTGSSSTGAGTGKASETSDSTGSESSTGGTSSSETTAGEGSSTAAGETGTDSAGVDDPCSRSKPGPDNTGIPAGVTLTPSGSITVEEDGAVIEGLDIEGTITVLADDVTIRNVRIRTGDYYPIRYFDEDNVGLVVEDSEIEGLGGNVTSGIAFANYTARRLNVHGGADGLKADSNVLIEDCWIHDLSNGPDEHNDAVQSTGGKGVTIRHSVLEGASNAAVQTGDMGGATEDLLIECSWLYGGGWTLNIRGAGDTVPRNTRILNNRFGRDAGYGPWALDDPDPIVEGNVYDDDDEPIPYP